MNRRLRQSAQLIPPMGSLWREVPPVSRRHRELRSPARFEAGSGVLPSTRLSIVVSPPSSNAWPCFRRRASASFPVIESRKDRQRVVPQCIVAHETIGRMVTKTYTTTIVREGSMCYIPVPFDPKAEFGRVRAPVQVTVNGYMYRSTIAFMGGMVFIPLRKSNREAAGLEGGEVLEVRLDLDAEERDVTPPDDFLEALKSMPPAFERWGELSFTHKREHVEALEGAKKPETRQRRLEASVKAIAERPAKKRK